MRMSYMKDLTFNNNSVLEVFVRCRMNFFEERSGVKVRERTGLL